MKISRWGRRLLILGAVVALPIIGSVVVFSGFQKNIDQIALFEFRDISIRGLPDGTYGGSQNNPPVTAEVEVRIQGGQIVSIILNEHSHGPDHGADLMIPRIIETQDLRVDGISGSTYSSQVLRKAIEKALLAGPVGP